MSHLYFHSAIIWSFLTWDKILELARFYNYKHMDDKNVEKDVRNKSNMLVSLYLKHANIIFTSCIKKSSYNLLSLSFPSYSTR